MVFESEPWVAMSSASMNFSGNMMGSPQSGLKMSRSNGQVKSLFIA